MKLRDSLRRASIYLLLNFFAISLAFSQAFQTQGGYMAPVTLQEASWYDDFKGKIQNTSNAADIKTIYFDTERGPYFDSKWFKAEIVTADDQVYEEEFKVRYDTYQQVLHYTYDYNEIKAFQTAYIKGFKLIDEEEKHIFVKIYPPLNEYAPSTSFYKVLHNGDYKLYELNYESLKINNWMGPGSDGRSTASFVNHRYIYIRDKDNYYSKVKYSNSNLKRVFKDDLDKFESYQKEKGKISNKKELIAFLNVLDNS